MNHDDTTSQTKRQAKHTHHLRYTDFEFIRVLGMGSYGKVELVRRKGIRYALKIIEKRMLAREGKEYQAFIERELMRRMNHPGVVALKTCFQDRVNLYFCLEFCEGGDFTNFLNQNQAKMTQELRVFYVAEIVSIIEYFQSIGIVHRDLKPENILLSEKGHLKIVDFGTAEVSECKLVDQKFKQQLTHHRKVAEQREIKASKQMFSAIKPQNLWKSMAKSESSSENENQLEEETTPVNKEVKKRKATFVGTCYYVAPELLEKEACEPATDLWALGCIIYQFYYLTPPFDGGSEFEIFEKIRNIEYSFPKNDHITEEAIDLIKQLLKQNPNERLGCNSREGLMMKDLKAHSFFKGFDFEDLFYREVPLLTDETESVSQYQTDKKQTLENAFVKEHIGILTNKPNILIHGVVQKRTFINYNTYYLIVFNNLKMLRIKVMEPGKTRQTHIDLSTPFDNKESHLPAEVLDPCFFRLTTKEKVYKFRCKEPSRWVNALNKCYRTLKEREGKEKAEEEAKQAEMIEKECKTISELLKTHKLPLQE